MMDHMISLLVHNSQIYKNHESLVLGIVVRRDVLVFFCFVVVVHLLINKCIVHPNSFVAEAC